MRKGPVVKLVSNSGVPRYPDMPPRNENIPKVVSAALDNLMSSEGIDASYPAPIGSANLDVASTAVTGSIVNLNNFTTSATFENVILQTGNPNAPVYVTAPATFSGQSEFTYSADSVTEPGSTLEVNQVGDQWGMLYNDTTLVNIISEYSPILNKQTWPVHAVSTQDVITVTDVSPNPGANCFTLTALAPDGVTIVTAACNAAGVATFTLTQTLNWLFYITYNDLRGLTQREAKVVVTDVTLSTARQSPARPYVVQALPFSNFQYVAMRSQKYRMNRLCTVVTPTIAELYEGGNMLTGKITDSSPPLAIWDDYLFSLKKHRLDNLKKGLDACWFPQANEWLMGNRYYRNPFTGQTVLNLTHIVYVSPTATAIVSLPIQVKNTGWIDYITLDTTIPTVPGIVFTDAWLTSVSIIEAYYEFTDNPVGKSMKNFVLNAAKFIMSGDPKAVAIRKAAKIAGSAIASVVPLLL